MFAFLIFLPFRLISFTLFVTCFNPVNATTNRCTEFLTLCVLSAKSCTDVSWYSIGPVTEVAMWTWAEVILSIEVNLSPVRLGTESP